MAVIGSHRRCAFAIYDHVGNFTGFRARSSTCKRWNCTTRPAATCAIRFSPVRSRVEDVVGTVRLNFAQRVKLYDGPAELSPGITLHPVGGHTPGMRPAIHCAPMRRARITSSPATTR